MRALIVVLVAFSCSLTSGAQTGQVATPDVQVLFEQLQNESTTNDAAGKLVAVARQNAAAREYIGAHLPQLIEILPQLAEKISQGAPVQEDVAENYLRLAGDLKMKEAVPALMILLPKTDTAAGTVTLAGLANLENDPIGKALAKIGDPSVGPVAQLLENGDNEIRKRAILILLKIGSPRALSALRNHVPKENDPDLRQFLIKRIGP